jgi:hypothetical protein
MRRALLIGCFVLLWFVAPIMAASDVQEGQKGGSNQGLTLEDIGRGLKSAAKNIGDEIPKIGPAIGETFKKATGKGEDQDKASKKPSGQNSAKDKK